MKKHYFVFTIVAVSCYFLVVLLNLFISNEEYSEQENRYLQGSPALSFEAIVDRSFMDDAENFSSDQLMFRDFFVRVKGQCEKLLGKKENNGVYFAKDGYLIEKAESVSNDVIGKNIEAIDILAGKKRYDVSVCVIPQAFEIHKDKLPKGVYNTNVRDLTKKISQDLKDADVKIVDTTSILEENKDQYIFYRTDHHQTSKGSYLVYRALGDALGYTPFDESEFSVEEITNDFLGTTYSKALISTEPDTIAVYKTEVNQNAQVEFFGEEKESSSIFFPEYLEKKDKYAYFLDGNHGVTVVKGGKEDGGSIAIFKDSYSHSLAPFLINHFETIHLLDMRYFQEDPIRYLGENGIERVLFLYGSSTFMTDITIASVGDFAQNSTYVKEGLVPECDPVDNSYFDNAVFLGDSLSIGLQSYSDIDNATFLCRTAMSVGGVYNVEDDGSSLVDKVKAANPKKIYVMLGVNEDIVPDNMENVMDKFSMLIDRLKEDNPEAMIYIQSLMPVSKKKSESGRMKNHVIYEYNEALLKLTEEKKVYFIDVYNAIKDDDGAMYSELTEDGVHLGKEGCMRWTEYLKKHAVLSAEDAQAESSNEESEETGFSNGEFKLDAIRKKIQKVVKFEGDVGETSPKSLLNTHKVDKKLIANASGMVGGGASAEEISLFEVKDKKDADNVEKALKEYVKNRIKSFEDYIPGEVPKLEKAVVYKNGKFVALVIAKDLGTAKKVIEQEIKAAK